MIHGSQARFISSGKILDVYRHQEQLLTATSDAEARHFWFRGFRRFVTPLIREAVVGCAAPYLLDVGCGTGRNVQMLRAYGTAFGLDYTFSGLITGRREGRRGLAQGSAASIPCCDDTFDVVTCFDVLQVLPDGLEMAALREIWRVLKPGGALILNVAALKVLHGHHALLSEEQRRYTRPELSAKLVNAGFRVKKLSYTNASLFPLMLAVRMKQRRDGLRVATTDIAVPPAPINLTFSALLAIEALAARYVSMPFGSSLLASATKPR